jgi:AraC family transcriptional regulator of adaptative response / DNA-3-methyladenine glycosylase II
VHTLAPVPVSRPFAGAALLDFLLRHTVAGVETGAVEGSGAAARVRYARTLRLPHGPAVLVLRWADQQLTAEVDADPRDHDLVLARVAHLVDADADPAAVDAHLGRDPRLADLVAATPGLRVPGVLDAAEMVFRTMIGQQVSLASARACGATITRRHGEPVATGDPELQWLFPPSAVLAAVDPETLPMPRTRARALVGVAERLEDGRLDLSGNVEPGSLRAQLLACPGIGPWTADYVLMRARHQPDVLLASDLVIGRELAARGITDPGRWSPYRSYATLHLWHDFLSRPR